MVEGYKSLKCGNYIAMIGPQLIFKEADMPEEKVVRGFAHTCLSNAVGKNTEVIKSCNVILEVLEKHPELDKHLCVAFGLLPMQPFKQV